MLALDSKKKVSPFTLFLPHENLIHVHYSVNFNYFYLPAGFDQLNSFSRPFRAMKCAAVVRFGMCTLKESQITTLLGLI